MYVHMYEMWTCADLSISEEGQEYLVHEDDWSKNEVNQSYHSNVVLQTIERCNREINTCVHGNTYVL